jgi:DNA-directed RNA polymerase subunit RPC12/RpoP
VKNVRCPRCKTEHRLPNDASGYTCSGCGADWVFAKCAQCHSTFHAPARTASWTCKRCGFRNVSTSAPEPELAPPRPPGRGLGASIGDRWNGLSPRGKLIAVAVPALVVVIVLVVALVGGGGGGGVGGGTSLAEAKASFCLHTRELTDLTERSPAVLRAAQDIKKDSVLFREAGDVASAKKLKDIVKAARKLAAAIGTPHERKARLAVEHAQLAGPQC